MPGVRYIFKIKANTRVGSGKEIHEMKFYFCKIDPQIAQCSGMFEKKGNYLKTFGGLFGGCY